MPAVATTIAAGVAARLAGEAVSGAGGRARRVVLGDPETKAFAAALDQAHAATREEFGELWGRYDVTLRCFDGEGADELALVLRGRTPNETRLAGALVDAMTPDLDLDERWGRIEDLQKPCRALVTRFRDALATHGGLRAALPAPTDDLVAEREEYLRWVTRRFRHVETTGIGTTGSLSLPLSEIFVTVRTSERDRHRHLHDEALKEKGRLEELARTGLATAEEVRAAIDRLPLRAAGRGDPAGPPAEPADVVDVVDGTPRLVVIGDPGSGKTTVLRFLALQHARALLGDARAEAVVGRPRLPVFVSIAEFMASGTTSLRAYLAEAPVAEGFAARPPRALFDQALRDGDVLLLLDGLDEVGRADRRAASTKAITALAHSLEEDAVSVVVTSRPAGYDAAPLSDRFRHVEVRDMDERAIAAFLDGYLPMAIGAGAARKDPALVEDEAAAAKKAMLAAMAANPGIRRLAANPLLLTAMVLVHRSSGGLPASRIEAYRQIDTALTETWRRQAGVGDDARPDADEVRGWLRALARWMHQHRPERSASSRDLVEVWGERWCRRNDRTWDEEVLDAGDPLESDVGRGVTTFVEEIAVHTGLLVERAPGRWGFAHLTFQEYYLALSLMQDGRRHQRPATIRGLLHRPDHDEAILLALGLMARQDVSEADRWEEFAATVLGVDPGGSWPGIAPSAYEDVLGRDLLFGLRALADDLDLPHAEVELLVERVVDELVLWSGRGRFTAYRQAALDRLAALATTRHGGAVARAVDRRFPYLDPDLVLEAVDEGVVTPGLIATLEVLAGDEAGAEPILDDDDEEVSAGLALEALERLDAVVARAPEAAAAIGRVAWDERTPPQVAVRAIALCASGWGDPDPGVLDRVAVERPDVLVDVILAADGVEPGPTVIEVLSRMVREAEPGRPELDALDALVTSRSPAALHAAHEILLAPDVTPGTAEAVLCALADRDALDADRARVAVATVERIADGDRARLDLVARLDPESPWALALVDLVERLAADPGVDDEVRSRALRTLASMTRAPGEIARLERLLAAGTDDPVEVLALIHRLSPDHEPGPAVVEAVERLIAGEGDGARAGRAAATLGRFRGDAVDAGLERVVASAGAPRRAVLEAALALARRRRTTEAMVEVARAAIVDVADGPEGAAQGMDLLLMVARVDGGPAAGSAAVVEALTGPDTDAGLISSLMGLPALVRRLPEEVVAVLGHRIGATTDPLTRRQLARILWSQALGSETAATTFLRILADDEAAVDLCRYLMPRWGTDVSPVLRNGLGALVADPGVDEEVAVWALLSLGLGVFRDGEVAKMVDRLPEQEAGRALLERTIVGEGPWQQGVWAARHDLIAHLGTRLERPVLEQALVDRDNGVRRVAAVVLVAAARADAERYAELIALLDDPALDVRDDYEHRTAWDYLHAALAVAPVTT